MRTIVTIIIALFVGVSTYKATAQTEISGQVNKYVPVTEVIPCDSMVRVGNPLTFKAGDRILLIQMKGAQIVDANTPEFGDITDLNGAGNAEFLTIQTVDDEEITFTTRMVHKYDPEGVVQLIYVPVYDNARVVAPLTPAKWNQTTGGVLAIEVRGDLYLDADITADSLGFGGGSISNSRSKCDVDDYVLNWAFGLAGGKGGGIGSLRRNYSIGGRGRMVNGGGGGNGNNAGGAGGGNGGAGGNGGHANLYCRINSEVGGIGGRDLTEFLPGQRFYMGGGGGGGHQNDLVGTNGQLGGGIIFIKASTLHGQNKRISANGASVGLPEDPQPPSRAAPGMDGAGGGGAGGTIVLDVDNVVSPVTVEANGGDGGDIIHEYNAHGPGGGGGGGVIITKRPFAQVSASVAAGNGGTHITPSNEAYGDPRGATAGESGVVISELTWRKPLSIALDISGGGKICEGVSEVTLEAVEGFASYTWSNGETGRVIQVSEPGSYSVVAVDSAGCVHTKGDLEVWYNPTLVRVQETLDFQAVPFEAYKRLSFPISNKDDEDIVLENITNSQNFTIIDPATYPVVIPAGQTIDVTVEFYAIADQRYSESIELTFSAPCPLTREIELTAIVSPIWADFHTPDTLAIIGDTTFSMPIYVDISPDTVVLDSSSLQISMMMDSRLFAPRAVTRGEITQNTIDLITNTRYLTVRVEDVDLKQDNSIVTRIIGSVLMANLKETPVELSEARWIKVWQEPVTRYEDGSIQVDPVCFQDKRFVKLFDMVTMEIAPNPVRDVMRIKTKLTAPGSYDIQVINTSGRVVHHQSINHTSEDTRDHTITINTSEWSSGTYVVRYSTPFIVYTENVVVQR